MNFHVAHKLRILMVGEYPRHGVVHGGVQAAVQALATALSMHPEVEALEIVDPRYDVNHDELVHLNPRCTIRFIKAQRRFTLPTRSLFTRSRVQRIADEFRPTVVHGHGLGERGFIAASLGYPAVSTIHGVGTAEMRLRAGASPARFIRETLYERMVDETLIKLRGIIAVSQYAHDFYRGRFAGMMARIPNAVREEFFREAKTFSTLPQLLFVGVISRVKNVTGILRAFAVAKRQCPEARLAIAGPFATENDHQEILACLQETGNDGITFLGNLQGNRLLEAVRDARALVLFSRHENSPVAVAEALALGTPVIASRIGGVPELVLDGTTGFLVESEDIAELSRKMLHLLRDPIRAARMGSAAREHARREWTPSAVAEQTLQVYRRLLS